jgi:hypothetical protein
MQENQTTSDSVPTVTTVPTNDQQPKQSNFLVILLSFLLITSLAIAGFFAFQTQKLVKELTLLRTEPTPMATAEPSTEPVATSSSMTVDPTANWEIYSNGEYSIKFPKSDFIRLICPNEELTATNRGTDKRISPIDATSCERGGRYELETKTDTLIQTEPEETKYYNIVKKDIRIDGILGKLYVYTFTEIEEGPYPKWFAIARVNRNNKTYEVYFANKNKSDLFDQILSTFKFTN